MSDPLASPASTTTTPLERAEMIRFRLGKFSASGAVPMGNSLMSAPASASAWCSAPFSGGYTTSMPQPRTAMLRPAAFSAPQWAAVSMPRAIPETTVIPWAARSRARRVAVQRPYCEARLEPTMAMAVSLPCSSPIR